MNLSGHDFLVNSRDQRLSFDRRIIMELLTITRWHAGRTENILIC